MSEARNSEIKGYYTRDGSLPRQVTAQPASDLQYDIVRVEGRPARIGEELFEREGDAVVAALRTNIETEQRLRQLLNTRGDDERLRGQLVEANERIITLQRRGAELEQLAQERQDHDDQNTASSSAR
jgi:hypothetical protein